MEWITYQTTYRNFAFSLAQTMVVVLMGKEVFNDEQEMEKWENPCCSRLLGMGGVNDFCFSSRLPGLQLFQHGY